MATQLLDFDEENTAVLEGSDELWGRLVADSAQADIPALDCKHGQVYTIGRDKECSITILSDMHVSSNHCKIYMEADLVWVEDTSRGGTYVNDTRLNNGDRKCIRNGDTLSLLLPRNTNDSRGHKFLFIEPVKTTDLVCKGEINNFYEILDPLGSGAFATVRSAVNRQTNEKVAVKIILRKQFGMDERAWEAQLQEANTLRKLDHPRIIKLVDMFKTEEALYIVTELALGGELFDRIIEKGPYPEERARILIKRILEAVCYLHARGIVHRDLKPENILLASKDDDLDIKVVDFGVAKELSQGCKTVIGSMSYIAPEVLERKNTTKGLGRYGESADMWSVGVIMFIVLVGKMPFNEAEDLGMYKALEQLVKFNTPSWDKISDEAKDFLASILVMDTEKRLTAKAALNHPWLRDGHEKEGDTQELKSQDTLTESPQTSNNNESSIAKRVREEHKEEDSTEEQPKRTCS